jgi:transposase
LLEAAENAFSGDFRLLLNGLQHDLQTLDERVAELDNRIQTLANSHPGAKRLHQIPGIGPITATALVSAVDDGKQFKHGRDMAA